jgi:hypothetical protein
MSKAVSLSDLALAGIRRLQPDEDRAESLRASLKWYAAREDLSAAQQIEMQIDRSF